MIFGESPHKSLYETDIIFKPTDRSTGRRNIVMKLQYKRINRVGLTAGVLEARRGI